MDNNKRLEFILEIRKIREKLNTIPFTKEEKEVLKQSLNFYEGELDLEIARMNHEITHLEEEGIVSSNKKVEVPLDEVSSRYKEYANIQQINIPNVVSSLLSSISEKGELSSLEQQILLISLKEYCKYLEQLEQTKKNNLENYEQDNDIAPKK